ncbi:hypothetical protein ACE193_21140 [Bernardetia sp. OM2101]|uniref:hypothetical protein n=1 Tax=Bernardetia sp. OM2101 TaxID=3344876 RepID=UPI0035D0AF21
MKKILFCLILFFQVVAFTQAQGTTETESIIFISADTIETEPFKSKLSEDEYLMQPQSITSAEVWRGAAIMIFSLILLGLVLGFTHLNKEKKIDTSVSQFLTLFMLIIPTVILVIMGYSIEQISIVLALFSTVAGYVLGRQGSAEVNKCAKEAKDNQQPENTNPNNN